MTDGELGALAGLFGESARLAAKAGFDGVDIKACHRYLLNEFLCAHTRSGMYGGSFENRARLMTEAFAAASAAAPAGFMLTTRLNVYDGFPYPYGFGVSPKNNEPDTKEPSPCVQSPCVSGCVKSSKSSLRAKRSNPETLELLDCFVADAPRNDRNDRNTAFLRSRTLLVCQSCHMMMQYPL
jgi:hypothetical protein